MCIVSCEDMKVRQVDEQQHLLLFPDDSYNNYSGKQYAPITAARLHFRSDILYQVSGTKNQMKVRRNLKRPWL